MKKLCVVAAAIAGLAALQAVGGNGGKDIPEEKAKPYAPVQLMTTLDLMKIMVDPLYEDLKDAVSKVPERRKDWRAIFIAAYPLGEITNLLLFRTDEDYMATEEWAKLTVESRDLVVEIVKGIKDKDYPMIKENYVAFIESCNKCHVQFQLEDAPEVKPWNP